MIASEVRTVVDRFLSLLWFFLLTLGRYTYLSKKRVGPPGGLNQGPSEDLQHNSIIVINKKKSVCPAGFQIDCVLMHFASCNRCPFVRKQDMPGYVTEVFDLSGVEPPPTVALTGS